MDTNVDFAPDEPEPNPKLLFNYPRLLKTTRAEYTDEYGNQLTIREYSGDGSVGIWHNGPNGNYTLRREQARSLAERLMRFANGGRVVSPEEIKDA